VGRKGGHVDGGNYGRVEDEGAWYEAQVEAQLLEDEGWCGRRYPSSSREVHRVHQSLAQAHHLLQLCLYPVQRHVVHRRAHVLGQVVHLSSCVVLSRSDELLVQRNFSEFDLN
jgi:hypothetical protein